MRSWSGEPLIPNEAGPSQLAPVELTAHRAKLIDLYVVSRRYRELCITCSNAHYEVFGASIWA